MGLLDHDDIELVGLPVGGLLQIKESEQCMNISLRQLYYNKVFHSKNTGSDLHRYPKTGRVVEGISYLVTGNDWLWLLPHNKIGVVRLTEFGVSRRDARDQCGWIGEVRVDAEEPEHDGMSMVRISPLING